MKKLIKVTQEHIDNGLIGYCYRCPIALALMDTFNTVNVSVSSFIQADWHTYNTPSAALRFMSNFDDGLEVKPFNFYLDI